MFGTVDDIILRRPQHWPLLAWGMIHYMSDLRCKEAYDTGAARSHSYCRALTLLVDGSRVDYTKLVIELVATSRSPEG